MKKQRPGVAAAGDRGAGGPGAAGRAGLRRDVHARPAHVRRRAPRGGAPSCEVDTRYGKVRMKVSRRRARRPSTRTAARLALAAGMPLKASDGRRDGCLAEEVEQASMDEKYYLTTPIYYVNSAPHIGHDVLHDRGRHDPPVSGDARQEDAAGDRHRRARPERRARGAEEGRHAAGVHRRGGRGIRASSGTGSRSRPLHPHLRPEASARRCSGCSSAAWSNGYIYTSTYTGQYCFNCELYVNDAKPGDPCPDCGRPTETVTEENYFFKLSAFQDRLLELYESSRTSSSPSTRRNEIVSFVKGGLQRSLDHPHDDQVGHPGARRRQARLLRLVRRADHLHERGEGRRAVARRPAPDRQGDRALPRHLLAGVPDGRRAAAAEEDLRARLASARTTTR